MASWNRTCCNQDPARSDPRLWKGHYIASYNRANRYPDCLYFSGVRYEWINVRRPNLKRTNPLGRKLKGRLLKGWIQTTKKTKKGRNTKRTNIKQAEYQKDWISNRPNIKRTKHQTDRLRMNRKGRLSNKPNIKRTAYQTGRFKKKAQLRLFRIRPYALIPLFDCFTFFRIRMAKWQKAESLGPNKVDY